MCYGQAEYTWTAVLFSSQLELNQTSCLQFYISYTSCPEDTGYLALVTNNKDWMIDKYGSKDLNGSRTIKMFQAYLEPSTKHFYIYCRSKVGTFILYSTNIANGTCKPRGKSETLSGDDVVTIHLPLLRPIQFHCNRHCTKLHF